MAIAQISVLLQDLFRSLLSAFISATAYLLPTLHLQKDDLVREVSHSALQKRSEITYRISNIPASWSSAILLDCIVSRGYQVPNDVDIRLFPACSEPTQTVLLTGKGFMGGFDAITQNVTKNFNIHDTGKSVSISIDRHFSGLTPLNGPLGRISAEYV